MRLRHTLFLVPFLAGCYVYQPVTSAVVPTDRSVRLTLTEAGTVNLAPELGPSVVAVAGKLVNVSPDAYVVGLTDTRRRNGLEVDWRGEQVTIPRSLIASLQQRQFSRGRTAAVTVGLIAALIAAQQAFLGDVSIFGGGNPGPGPGPR